MFETDERTKARTAAQTKGTAESMTYTEATRRLVFARGKGEPAALIGSQGDLLADRIEVFLGESGDEVDRLEAEGSVITVLPQRRAASGRHLVYTTADGRYVMVGAPVEIQEQLEEGCRITTGATLTFFRSTDRIVADGNQERRTQTKQGAKCTGPGFK
jgi:lipopolysaccharide export system protein LptA